MLRYFSRHNLRFYSVSAAADAAGVEKQGFILRNYSMHAVQFSSVVVSRLPTFRNDAAGSRDNITEQQNVFLSTHLFVFFRIPPVYRDTYVRTYRLGFASAVYTKTILKLVFVRRTLFQFCEELALVS